MRGVSLPTPTKADTGKGIFGDRAPRQRWSQSHSPPCMRAAAHSSNTLNTTLRTGDAVMSGADLLPGTGELLSNAGLAQTIGAPSALLHMRGEHRGAPSPDSERVPGTLA